MLKRTAFLVCLGLVSSACDTAAPTIREEIPFRVLVQSGHFFDEYTQASDGGQENVPALSIALTSAATEAEFLNSYPRRPFETDDGGPFYEPFPSVDYGTETAVVVALGTVGSGSITVRVDSVVSDGQRATVYTTTVFPCIGTRDFVNPAAIVALEGSDRTVVFSETAIERQECF